MSYPRRSSTYPTVYKKKYPVRKYPKRKYPLEKKNYQTKFELKQPTYRTSRTAMQSSLTQTPIWPVSKLIHNQLYYDYQQTLSSATGLVSSRVYTANGLFDPDITGTGHQPIGFDQLMLAYEHYSTIRSKITVTFNNTINNAARVGVYLSPDGTPITDPIRLMENGLIKTITLNAGQGSIGNQHIDLNCDLKLYNGKKSYSQLLEDDFRGSVAANPVEQAYFIVFAFGNFSTDSMNVQYDAIISYDSIYTEPRKLTIS